MQSQSTVQSESAAPGRGPHPRPQLVRDRWSDLSGTWGFAYDDADVGLTQSWQSGDPGWFTRDIVVPFPPESQASGIHDNSYHPVLWYRRAFRATHTVGERLLLHFEAVDYHATVWVDGHLVAEHEGGHTRFSADITDVVDANAGPNAEYALVVRCEDEPLDLEQPRGKQDWELDPHAIWYARTSGIWRRVWLEPVPAINIEYLRWTPDVEQALLRLDVRLDRVPAHVLHIRLQVRQHGELVADTTTTFRQDRASVFVRLRQADTTLDRTRVLWSPENPNLFDADLTLLDGGDVIDEVHSYCGLRSIGASAYGIALNDRPYFLRLVLNQAFWPTSHLAAPDPDAYRRDVEQIRALGFNGVRLHQKTADPEFLYWCDRLGLLVWAEMPAAYEFSDRMITRVTHEWLELLHRDYNHPCVIAWVPFNESWGVPEVARSARQRDLVRALYYLTKSLDDTRLVIGNDGWEQVVTDVITVHDYTAHSEVLTRRYGSATALDETLRTVQPGYRAVLLPDMARNGQPMMITEFGGISYNADGGSTWQGYSAVGNGEQLLARYRALVDALLDAPNVAGFCYTQYTDTMQEKNGLLTADRRPKADVTAISHVNRRPPAAVPADEIGSFEYGDYPPTVMDTAVPGTAP